MAFEITPEVAADWKRDLTEEVTPHLNGEELVSVAAFRRGGSSASFAASKMGGGLPYLATRLASKKKAGGLPQDLILALTPTKLYAFKRKQKGRRMVVKEEVAVWERAGLRVSTDSGLGMTQLIIESPAEDEKVTLVGASIKDDPVSLEFIDVLKSEAGG
ncbi:MAG: hypothetical protein EXQ70_11885 [Solirubrobacterales bacterium]|nr:hypothetical protein [Solirubrobacterales bacterium]